MALVADGKHEIVAWGAIDPADGGVGLYPSTLAAKFENRLAAFTVDEELILREPFDLSLPNGTTLHAAILSSKLSVWHTIFTPADDLINKVVAELGTAKGMNEESTSDGDDKSDDGPRRGGKAVQQWLFAQKSGVSILLGGYMLLTAIQQFEAAQFQGPPAAPPPMPPVQPPGLARLCDNTCILRVGQTVAGCTAGQPCPSQAMNNQCEDGFEGATRTCEVGTDCFDCSYRDVGPPRPRRGGRRRAPPAAGAGRRCRTVAGRRVQLCDRQGCGCASGRLSSPQMVAQYVLERAPRVS